MSLGNKTFKNNITGDIIKVIDSFEDIAILEGKGKASVSELMNPDLYTEQIDPTNFFNNQGAYNNLAEKIKSIPSDKIRDDEGAEVMINVDGNNFGGARPSMNESAIIMTTEEDERAELARKYGVSTPQNDITKQNEAFDKILNPEKQNTKVEVNQKPMQEFNTEYIQPQPTQKVEDPIITMFKNVKRIKEFSISLEIKNKIPRPDFIEMMEDSYNTSIIDFLAAEFTDNILKNPHLIEDMIRQKIKEVVYGVEVGVKDVNPQITDSVTQLINDKKEDVSFDEKDGEVKTEKPKATRKPRPNTTQGERSGARTTRSKKEVSK
jgi:hypothetical protein